VGLRISNNARTNEAMLMVRNIPMVLFLELDETNTHNYFKSKKNKQYIDHKKRTKGQATIYRRTPCSLNVIFSYLELLMNLTL
jgi:hypothetical protein